MMTEWTMKKHLEENDEKFHNEIKRLNSILDQIENHCINKEPIDNRINAILELVRNRNVITE